MSLLKSYTLKYFILDSSTPCMELTVFNVLPEIPVKQTLHSLERTTKRLKWYYNQKK